MTGIVIARTGMLAAGVPLNIDWKQIPVRGIENIQKEDISRCCIFCYISP